MASPGGSSVEVGGNAAGVRRTLLPTFLIIGGMRGELKGEGVDVAGGLGRVVAVARG